MKKSYFICAFVAIFFVACAPQVTVTSEVTVTLTPVPTPTLHPQFIALQESIATPGGRFTLQADGLIYDGATPIPGITVAPDGTMSLEVNGETITLDPADVDFDDEKGISIGGYEWDEEEGAWVEANETVTIAGGLKLEIGEQDENGLSEVEETTLPFNLTAEEKAEKEYQMDATTFGFAPDATRLVYDNETDTLKIVSTTDPTNVIAEWGRSDTTGQAEMIYDFSKMVDENVENVLLSVGWVEEVSGGKPKDPKAAERDADLIDNYALPSSNEMYAISGNRSGVVLSVNILGNNRRIVLPGFFIASDSSEKAPQNVDKTEGVLVFRLESGSVVEVAMVNFDGELRSR